VSVNPNLHEGRGISALHFFNCYLHYAFWGWFRQSCRSPFSYRPRNPLDDSFRRCIHKWYFVVVVLFQSFGDITCGVYAGANYLNDRDDLPISVFLRYAVPFGCPVASKTAQGRDRLGLGRELTLYRDRWYCGGSAIHVFRFPAYSSSCVWNLSSC